MCLALVVLAVFVPAPLQEEASLAHVPNPVKSAWFLLWIQEIVSYSKYLINLVLIGAVCALLLPWLPRMQPAHNAAWLPRDQRWTNFLTIAAFGVIVALTILAMFFRCENWALCIPF